MQNFSVMGKGPITSWLINRKFARSLSRANSILVVISILSLFVTFHTLKSTYTTDLIYLEDLPLEIRESLTAEVLSGIPSRRTEE